MSELIAHLSHRQWSHLSLKFTTAFADTSAPLLGRNGLEKEPGFRGNKNVRRGKLRRAGLLRCAECGSAAADCDPGNRDSLCPAASGARLARADSFRPFVRVQVHPGPIHRGVLGDDTDL